jgi:hypothetical protein
MKSIALLLAAAAAAATITVATAPTAAIAAAPTADISGNWTTEFDSQVGKQTYTYTIAVAGGKLTGHAKSNLGEGDIAGTVDGATVTFVENLKYQDMELAITYHGEIVSADEMHFKRDVAGQGGEEFTLKRQK